MRPLGDAPRFTAPDISAAARFIQIG
jgi:hypothetical protein